jgi:hypothetical protein
LAGNVAKWQQSPLIGPGRKAILVETDETLEALAGRRALEPTLP